MPFDSTPIVRLARGSCFIDVEIVAKGTHDDVVRGPSDKLLSLIDLFGSGWVVVRNPHPDRPRPPVV